MNPNDFSYISYKNLLRILRGSRVNLCFRDFAEGNTENNFFILRHDVDYSPEAALMMAELETDLEIKATYFVLFSSPYYNLLSEEYVLFPKKLIELGHEVGLHYDIGAMGKGVHDENLLDRLSLEIDLLSRLAGSDVKSIARHESSSSGPDPFQETEFTNASDDRYTKQISYFSDSCGAWRDDFVEHLSKDDFPMQMQLLIHPLFWAPTSLSRWETLDAFTQNRVNDLLTRVQQRKEMWRNHAGVIQHERRVKRAIL